MTFMDIFTPLFEELLCSCLRNLVNDELKNIALFTTVKILAWNINRPTRNKKKRIVERPVYNVHFVNNKNAETSRTILYNVLIIMLRAVCWRGTYTDKAKNLMSQSCRAHSFCHAHLISPKSDFHFFSCYFFIFTPKKRRNFIVLNELMQ